MEYSFEDVLTIRNGRNQKAVENPNGKYPIYGSGGIMGYADDFICSGDTVIIGRKGNINNPIYVSEPFWNVDTAFGLESKNDLLNPRYLYYFCKRFDFEKLNKTVTIPSLTKSDLLKIRLNVPELSIQEEIVSKLVKLEKIVQLRLNELQKLDELVKARFVEMFGSVEKKIPLSTLCDVSGGYSFKSGDITSDGAVKILQIGNVYLDDISWETTNYLPKGYDETYSRFLLNKGDIVVALTRPIIQSLGNVKACIVRDLDLPCLLNQRVGRIVPRNNREVSNQFIYGCLMTCDFTRYVKSCCIGCSQPNISSNDIGNYMIPDVSFNEQMMFVNFKEQIDKSKVAIQKSLAETQLLFDKLMQDYFG